MTESVARLLVELGLLAVGLAVVARTAHALRLSAIPFYLLLGMGVAALASLELAEQYVALGADIGVLLLLFMIGLQYTGSELATALLGSWKAAVLNFVLNFLPGVVAGFLMGWGSVAALVLGGVTFCTSTGVMAKVLEELGRLGNRETPAVLSVSVTEDLTMAVYLPLLSVLLVGTGLVTGLISMLASLAAVAVVFALALTGGEQLSRIISSRSPEVLLLSMLGLVLVVGGVAEGVQASSAVGAFLVGIAVSGEVAERTRELLGPLRDLFAAAFFLFFGLQINAVDVPPVLLVAGVLAAVTATTKVITGWYAARALGVARRGRLRAGFALIPRGEFSIVIAGIGVAAGLDPALGAFAAAYVLLTAIAGSILPRYADPIMQAAEAIARPFAPRIREP